MQEKQSLPWQVYIALLNYPKSIFIALFTLTFYLMTFIPSLTIDASGDSLVLEGDKSLAVYRNIHKTYGTSDFLFLAYQPKDDLYAKSTREQVAALAANLQSIEGVESVVTYLDVPLLYSPKVNISSMSDGVKFLSDDDIDIDLARQEFLNSPVYKQLLTSADETTTALQVNLVSAELLRKLRQKRDEAKQTEPDSALAHQLDAQYKSEKKVRQQLEDKLLSDVRSVVAEHQQTTSAHVFIGGVAMIVSDMLEYVREDMKVFGTAILVFIVVLLAYFFRALRWVFLPLISCFLTTMIMLGTIGALGINLTVVSANFVALLLIITLSINIHLLVRFIEYDKSLVNVTQQELAIKTARFMFKPCLYTALTTMVAFLSLIISGIRPVIEFGWMMTATIVLALVLSFIVLPAGVMMLKPLSREYSDKESIKLTSFFAHFTLNHKHAVSALSLLLLVFAGLGVLQLKVENRFIDYFDSDTPIFQGMLVIDEKLGGTMPLEIIINHQPKSVELVQVEEVFESDDDFFDDDVDTFANEQSDAKVSYWFTTQGLGTVQKLHDFLDAYDETGKVLSLATLYQVIKDVSGGQVDDIQLAVVQQSLGEEVKQSLLRPYLSENGEQARLSVRVKESSRSLNRSQLIQEIDDFMRQELALSPENYEISGMLVMYNNMLQSLYSSQISTLAAVFVAIMLMFAILFRSIKLALLAILPNILAAMLILACMGWLGIPLDIMTITIAAITVGIGVDDTIHYIHRFTTELAVDGDYRASVLRSHESIGLAMFYTSTTIIIGFSILALSNFNPSVYFGLLTAAAMFAALLGALVLLPHLLMIFKPIKVDSKAL